MGRAAVQTWSFSHLLSIEPSSVLDAIVKLGVSVVEVGYTGASSFAAFAEACGNRSIRILGVHLGEINILPISDQFQRCRNACKSLGCDRVVLTSNHQANPDASTYYQYATAAQSLGRLLAGCNITLEFHLFTFDLLPLLSKHSPSIDKMTGLDILAANTEAKAVGFQIDTYYASRKGLNATDVLKRLGTRCTSLHLNDIDANDGPTTIGASNGTINWDTFADTIQERGIRVPQILEHRASDPEFAFQESLRSPKLQRLERFLPPQWSEP